MSTYSERKGVGFRIIGQEPLSSLRLGGYIGL